MKYSLIKWIGTIIIVGVGLYFAVKYTYTWKVSEVSVYKLVLPEYTFTLKDGRQLELTMSPVFKTKQLAKDASTSKLELIDLFNKIFRDVDSTSFSNNIEIENVKAKILIELRKAKYPVDYIYFDSEPKFL